MEKIKYHPKTRSKKESVGSVTGLMDKNRNYLLVGDEIRLRMNYFGTKECKVKAAFPYYEKGRLLYNRETRKYGFVPFYSLWYGEKNEYDFNCYGKFIEIPSDNGMRMEIEKI